MAPRDFLSPVYFLIYSLFSYFLFFLFSLSWTYLPTLSHSFCLSSFFLLSSIRYSFCDLNSFDAAFFLCHFLSTSYPLSFPCHFSPVLFSLFLLSCFLHLPFLTFPFFCRFWCYLAFPSSVLNSKELLFNPPARNVVNCPSLSCRSYTYKTLRRQGHTCGPY